MKVLNNFLSLSLYSFVIVVLVMVSCSDNESSSQRVQTEDVISLIKPVEDKKTPACYSESDLDSPDTTSLHIILRKISEIKEVRNFNNENKNMILYCVTETGTDNVYQSHSYRIQVVLDTEDHYSVRFNFYVNKQTKEIKVLEVINDTLMTIEEWRKTQ
jgi:hypothetical protein